MAKSGFHHTKAAIELQPCACAKIYIMLGGATNELELAIVCLQPHQFQKASYATVADLKNLIYTWQKVYIQQ